MQETSTEHAVNGPCADFEWMVGPYVDGELPPGELPPLAAHLDGCAGCRGLAEQFRNLDALARRSSSAPAVSAAEWGAMWQTIERESQQAPVRVLRWRDWVVPALSAAALVLLSVWVGVALLRQSEGKRQEMTQNPESPEVHIEHFRDGEAKPAIDIQSDGNIILYGSGDAEDG